MIFQMKPLATNQQLLTWFCVHQTPANNSPPPLHILFTVFFLSIEINGLAASLVYFLKTVANDLGDSLHALFQIFAISGAIYLYVVAFLVRNKISGFLRTLENICDASKNFKKSSNIFFSLQTFS